MSGRTILSSTNMMVPVHPSTSTSVRCTFELRSIANTVKMLSWDASGASKRYLSNSATLFSSANGWSATSVASIIPDFVVSSCIFGGFALSWDTRILEMHYIHHSLFCEL